MHLPQHYFFTHTQFITDEGFWNILTATATSFAVIVALFGQRFWEWFLRPKVQVLFDVNSERCYRWAIVPKDNLQDQGDIENVKRRYFRLKVSNSGLTTVRGLRIKAELYDIQEKSLADRFEPTALRWISGSDSVDLAPGEDDYLNLISQVLEPLTVLYKLRIEVANRSPRGIAWDRYVRKWKVKVTFHADNLFQPVIKFFEYTPSTDDKEGKLAESFSW